jgi:hypothetical protein
MSAAEVLKKSGVIYGEDVKTVRLSDKIEAETLTDSFAL